MSAPQNGFTPLTVAAGGGKEAMVQMLLKAGADMEAKDKVGRHLLEGVGRF